MLLSLLSLVSDEPSPTQGGACAAGAVLVCGQLPLSVLADAHPGGSDRELFGDFGLAGSRDATVGAQKRDILADEPDVHRVARDACALERARVRGGHEQTDLLPALL